MSIAPASAREAAVRTARRASADRRGVAPTRSWGTRALRGVALVAVAAFVLLPIAYLVTVSFTRQSDILDGGVLPTDLTTENWPRAFRAIEVPTFLRNSLVAAGLGALLSLAIAVPGAYAMARYRLAGGRLLGIVLSTYIAPPILAVFPLFYLLRSLGLTDSVWALALTYGMANVPVAVWLLEGFVRRVPVELEEAARVDGCGMFETLVRIVLPLLVPGIVAAGIVCFILGYNEFLFARFFTSSTEAQTLPFGISLFQGDRQVQFGQMAAASLTGIVPVYLLAVFFQRWLIGGLTNGAIK